MTQKFKFGGSKMGRLMKRMTNIKDIPAQKVLEIYWETTVDYGVYLIKKHDTGKKLSQREQGIIDFIETIVNRVENLKGGDILDGNQQTANSPDTCGQKPARSG